MGRKSVSNLLEILELFSMYRVPIRKVPKLKILRTYRTTYKANCALNFSVFIFPL